MTPRWDDLPLVCPECGGPAEPKPTLRASQCDRCHLIVLPPDLEELWQRMATLRAHPLFWEAVEKTRYPEPFARLLFIPRAWLADRRWGQVREAMGAIEAEIAALEAGA